MPDMTAIAGLVSSLRLATDISKAIVGLRDAAMVQGKVIELQGVILSAQQSALSAQNDQFALLERIRDFEKQVADLKAWDAEKQKYELKAIEPGSFAYILKQDTSSSKPPHWLCEKCYTDGRKSVLQSAGTRGHNSVFRCNACNSSILVHYTTNPESVAQQSRPQPPLAPGDECPRCGAREFRVKKAKMDPTFAVLGVRVYEMECSSCSFTDERQVSGT